LSNVRDWFFAQRCGLVVGRNAVNTGRTASARIAGKKINEDSLPDTSARRTTMVWSIVATVCIGAFMGQLDASITQLVLPALEHKFSASIAEASWVAVMYLLVISVMLPIFGRLADMHGRKTLYVAGLVVFVAGSAMCGFASSLAWLIMTRALQAVGAAMLSANSVAIIVSVAGEKLRGRALGIMSAVQAVGLCAGPTVGGWIVDTLDWRWVFWVNVPFGIAAAALASFVIPEMSAGKPGSRFDTIGAVLLAPGLGALMLAINQVGSWGLTFPRRHRRCSHRRHDNGCVHCLGAPFCRSARPAGAVQEMAFHKRQLGQPTCVHHSLRAVFPYALCFRANLQGRRSICGSPSDDDSNRARHAGADCWCPVRPPWK
jgi:hypothetical protein